MADEYIFLRQDASRQTKQFSTTRDVNEFLASKIGVKFREYRRLLESAVKFKLELPSPAHIDFESSYKCNLRCVMCTHAEGREEPRRPDFMDFELFKKVVDEGVKHNLYSIGLDQEGEPLLNKRLTDYISYAKNNGILDVMFNTNALALTEDWTEKLLTSGLTRIHFSLDAFTRETYEKIRIGSNFDKVINNVLYFCRRKKELGIELPVTRVSFVKTKINEHELNEFMNFWKDKVDYIAVQEYNSPYPHINDLKNLRAKKREINKDYKCTQPWFRMVVLTDGSVMPCCLLGYSRMLIVGNAYKDDIYDLWNSEKVRNLRKIHKDAEYYKNPVCSLCADNFI